MTILIKIKKFFIKIKKLVCKPWDMYVAWVAKGFDDK
tara:strand:+ start:183 stop:293 length:111 start_codon:yes stop_codon:yes gene_type:complete